MKKDKKLVVVEGKEKVILFPTCFVNYNNPNLGLVAKELFNKLGIEHKFFYEMCCGMPQLEGGDIKSVTNKAKETSLKLKSILMKVIKFCQ